MKTMIIFLALACAGCDYGKPPNLMLLQDAATGCMFVGNVPAKTERYDGEWKAQLAPLMGADGKQIFGARPWKRGN